MGTVQLLLLVSMEISPSATGYCAPPPPPAVCDHTFTMMDAYGVTVGTEATVDMYLLMARLLLVRGSCSCCWCWWWTGSFS